MPGLKLNHVAQQDMKSANRVHMSWYVCSAVVTRGIKQKIRTTVNIVMFEKFLM